MRDKNNPNIIAKIQLFPTEKGGRKTPVTARIYRCPIGFGGEYFDCGMFLGEIKEIRPGSEVVLPIVFLSPDLIMPRLSEGQKFLIHELGIVGEGTILQVFQS